VAAAQAAPVTVLRGARLIDGQGGAPIEPASVVVQGDRIVAAGLESATPAPAGAKVIDLRGKTLIPGLISNHAHVGQTNGANQGEANDTRDNILRQLRQYSTPIPRRTSPMSTVSAQYGSEVRRCRGR
jgi:imidazolonepropionase-like amidohydrolase